MEPLIIGLIIMAVTALFNKDKQKPPKESDPKVPQPQQRSKPQQAAQTFRDARDPAKRQGAKKRIEDYARDLYKDLQAEMQQKAPESREEAVETVKQAAQKAPRPSRQATRRINEAAQVIDNSNAIYRNDIKRGEVRDTIASQNDLFPLDAKDVQRGVIMAEILGQPKARKK